MTQLILPSGLTAEPPKYFDHTATGTFGECERMAYYQVVLARKRKEPTPALDWGSTFHGCADIIETTGDIEEVEMFINLKLDEHIDDHYGRTKSRMFECLIKWVEWRKTHPVKMLRAEQPTLIKCDGSVDCPYFEGGCGLQYGGIMDRIVEWQGYVGPLDFKTTVMTNSDPANQWRLSHQMMGYDWIASHLMGKHCWGVIIERVITNKSKIEFDRFPISFSRHLIQEWVENEKVIQADFKYKLDNFADQESRWRQNRGRCWEPYPCQYREVCLAPRERGFRDRWLLNNTREERWDFMNRDKVEEIAQPEPLKLLP